MNALNQVALEAITALAPYAAVIVGALISAFLDELRRKTKSERVQGLLTRLERASEIAVHDIEQTIVPGLRNAAADGKITREEAEGLQQSAQIRIRKMMGRADMKELDRAMRGDVDAIVRSVVEAKVKSMRRLEPTAFASEKVDTRSALN